MCKGYNERKDREWKQKQIELHLMRFIGASIHNIGAGFSKDAEGIKPGDLIELPMFDSEEQPEPVEIDKEHFKELIKKDGKQWPHESD